MNDNHKESTTAEEVLDAQPKGATVPPDRRKRRAAETRVRLFRCALQLFAERGFPNVTVEDITEAADVGKGTFFNYFESKDHVLGVMAEIQLGKVKDAASRAPLSKQPIYAVLRRLAQRLAEEPGRSPGLARAFISSFLTSPSVREILKRNMQEGRKAIGGLIVEGQRRVAQLHVAALRLVSASHRGVLRSQVRLPIASCAVRRRRPHAAGGQHPA